LKLRCVVQIGNQRFKALTQLENNVIPAVTAPEAEAFARVRPANIARRSEPVRPSFEDRPLFLERHSSYSFEFA
jgi:hypothetical protein